MNPNLIASYDKYCLEVKALGVTTDYAALAGMKMFTLLSELRRQMGIKAVKALLTHAVEIADEQIKEDEK